MCVFQAHFLTGQELNLPCCCDEVILQLNYDSRKLVCLKQITNHQTLKQHESLICFFYSFYNKFKSQLSRLVRQCQAIDHNRVGVFFFFLNCDNRLDIVRHN